MKRTVQFLTSLVLLVMVVSCDSQQTLQGYYVDNQETSNFLSVDIPPSIVGLDETALSETQRKAFKSVKRLNFLGYRATDTINTEMKAELVKVKNILKNEKYEDLMEFNDKMGKITVKYVGDEDSAEEFIILASNPETGFGIVRVLGNDMKPEEMVTLVDAMKNTSFEQSKLDNIMNFYK